MFILTYNIEFKALDEKIEISQINDIFNVFYESPLEITTDEYGYGYLEKEVNFIDIKVAYDEDKNSLEDFMSEKLLFSFIECIFLSILVTFISQCF